MVQQVAGLLQDMSICFAEAGSQPTLLKMGTMVVESIPVTSLRTADTEGKAHKPPFNCIRGQFPALWDISMSQRSWLFILYLLAAKLLI
jgi:hypothetical protein